MIASSTKIPRKTRFVIFCVFQGALQNDDAIEYGLSGNQLFERNPITYSLKVEDHEDGYLTYFPALPGCYTWGRTFEVAAKNAEEALNLYHQTLAENGDPIPKEQTNAPVSLGVTVRTPIIA